MSSNKAFVIIILIVFGLILLMLPLRNQGFTDDFAYAQSVKIFSQTGQVQVSEWLAPTTILQIFWGGIFVKIFGFSFKTLHISTIVLLPILAIFVFKILELFKIPTKSSFILTLFFLSIPWILQFTFTFMSDIPFLTLETAAIYFYLKGIKENSTKSILLGSLFCALAFLLRQTGMVFALSFGLASLYKQRKKLFNIFFSTGIPLLVCLLYFLWLLNPDHRTAAQYYVADQTKRNIVNIFLRFDTQTALVLLHRTLNLLSLIFGLFFPILILLVANNPLKFKKFLLKNKIEIILASFIVGCFYALDLVVFFKKYTAGFPLILFQYEPFFPWANLWKYFVLISIPLWSFLIIKFVKKLNRLKAEDYFLALIFILILISSVIGPYSWEEYVIPLLPIALFFLARYFRNFRIYSFLTLIVVAILLLDSLQMTKLRYEEESTVWEKALNLTQNGVPPEEINANSNIAWDGWFNFEKRTKVAIENNHGSKNIGPPKIIINSNPQYLLLSKTQNQFMNMDTSKAQKFTVTSLFVKSQVFLFKYD